MCGSKWIQGKDLSVMTKPIPTGGVLQCHSQPPGCGKSTSTGSGNMLHIAIHPSPVQGRAAGTGHTCPLSKPSGTQLRLAKEALAPQRPSALCLPLAHRTPEPPVLTAAPPAWG